VKLRQGQIWNQGDQYLHIVFLERLEVQYKAYKNLATRKGTLHHVSKKEFCRLLKHATLLSPAEIGQARNQADASQLKPDGLRSPGADLPATSPPGLPAPTG
jgi:hypothetical protein